MTTAPVDMQLQQIVDALARARFRYVHEHELHDGIAALLESIGIPVGDADREVTLSRQDRIDFLLPSGIGIEVKVDGGPRDVWRQLGRYATHDRIQALLLITTRARHAVGAPTTLHGTPVRVAVLRGGLR